MPYGTEAPTPTEPGDLLPSFGDATLAAHGYRVGTAISPLVLPAATGGEGRLSYALTPALPPGLMYTAPADATTGGTLNGTPTAPQAETTYTLTATDADGDTATLAFLLTITDRGRGPLRATLLNLSSWQAWVHLYCLKDRVGPVCGDVRVQTANPGSRSRGRWRWRRRPSSATGRTRWWTA